MAEISNTQNLNAHYSTNAKVQRPARPVAYAPNSLPKPHLINDTDANNRMKAINQDIYIDNHLVSGNLFLEVAKGKTEKDEISVYDPLIRLGNVTTVNTLEIGFCVEDINGDVVISTIQKLFAVLTGQTLSEEDEDKEDEILLKNEDEKNVKPIVLGKDLKLPPDYFQFIIVDECHRSIYGKWQSVLNYFTGAKILGLIGDSMEELKKYYSKLKSYNGIII